jgi:DNA (cytosine-5)-methyltransferase 1
VDEAISDLPPLGNSEGAESMAYISAPLSEYQRQARNGSEWVFNHVAPQLAPVNLERMNHIPQGGSWRDLPYHLLPAGMKLANRSDHTKRYGRLHPNGQACTILTRCDVHWGAYIHPYQDRAITVREAARFQSFTDKFQFLGSRGEQYKQVGNAVPPFLAKAVATAVASMLTEQTFESRT